MNNPNEYDDDAFTEASVEFQGQAAGLFEKLWKAGATQSDLVNEINNALAEAGITSLTGGAPMEVRNA